MIGLGRCGKALLVDIMNSPREAGLFLNELIDVRCDNLLTFGTMHLCRFYISDNRLN